MRGEIWLVAGAIVVFVGACASPSPPTDHDRPSSEALEDASATTADRLFVQEVEAQPGQSGFKLLLSGEEAFATRDGMIAVADETVDAQYFSWDPDQTGKLLLDRLIRAAERGVRVRLLLDDILTDGLDIGLAHLDNLPNVEVRVFNPFESREFRAVDFFTDFSRVNRRMHNKALVVDNTVAVIGGRNIGNHYFGVDTVFNYRDLDLLAVGPVVRQISHVFDSFWNSEWTVPITAYVDRDLPLSETRERQAELHEWAEAGGDDYPYKVLRDRSECIEALSTARDDLIWPTLVELLYDDPEKAGGEEPSPIVARGRALREQLEEEMMVEVAYFVPDGATMEAYRELVRRGVRVRVLTNSLTSIDVVPAFAGYTNYREALLRQGVELHELKADLAVVRKYWSLIAARSRATLHTKSAVFDRKTVWIGSFNADPRSRRLNTEIGVLIHSPELAQQVADFVESGMDRENSYEVILDGSGGSGERLIWIEEEDGKEKRYDGEPEAPAWLVASAWFMSLLPIEEQL